MTNQLVTVPNGQAAVLTVPETAKYLSLPVSKVYELVKGKDFPAIKIGKSWRILKDNLDQWLLKQLEEKQDNLQLLSNSTADNDIV